MTWISHWGSEYYSDVMDRFGEAQVNNANIIFSYLYKNGFSRAPIMAMLGNMMTESYLNPGQWQHGYSPYDGNEYNGMGLVGWTPYWRITDWLTSHGYDLNDAESYGYGMLDKLIEECFDPQEVTWIATDSYPISFSEFAGDTSHSIEWLTNAFLYNYERPATTPQPDRAEQAKKWSEILPEVPGGTYTPRLDTSGMDGSHWYYSDNPFYQSGYGLPNCTCYAWGRRAEILDAAPTLSLGNADTWFDRNIQNGAYPYGYTPQLGAIAVWKYTGSMEGEGGHVAVVEQINDDGTVVTSNSAWGGSYFYLQTLSSDNGYEWDSFTSFQGFIYLPENFYPAPKPPNKVAFVRWIPA